MIIIPIMISRVIGSNARPLGKALWPNTCCSPIEGAGTASSTGDFSSPDDGDPAGKSHGPASEDISQRTESGPSAVATLSVSGKGEAEEDFA